MKNKFQKGMGAALVACTSLCFGLILPVSTAHAELSINSVSISTSTATVSITNSTTGYSKFVFLTDMKVGSYGSDVAELQTFLISRGFSIPALENGTLSKGFFGSQTREAVIKYQVSIGVPGTGYVGQLTRKKLNEIYGNTSPVTVVSPNGGENWNSLSHHRIAWSSSFKSGDKVDIYLLQNIVCANQFAACVVAPITLDKNIPIDRIYNWIVGTDVDNNVIPNGMYKVMICSPNNLQQCDSSDAWFNITPATSSQASVTTVTPNGGEVWQMGSVQTIKWAFNKTDVGTQNSNYFIDIRIKNHPDVMSCPVGFSCTPVLITEETIAENIPASQQSYIWTVGTLAKKNSTLWNGNYDIEICFAGTKNCAVSDAPFTIQK